jgi:hypothetical protein
VPALLVQEDLGLDGHEAEASLIARIHTFRSSLLVRTRVPCL